MTNTKWLSRLALVAALYAMLTLMPPFSSLGYGPVQIRVAEALTVLPFVSARYAWALYLGCLIANLGSPFLVYDLTIGASVTLVAGLIASKMPGPLFAPLPAVVLNALIVSWYVSYLSGLPYVITALYIALGQMISCYGIGYPLLLYISRNKKLRQYFVG